MSVDRTKNTLPRITRLSFVRTSTGSAVCMLLGKERVSLMESRDFLRLLSYLNYTCSKKPKRVFLCGILNAAHDRHMTCPSHAETSVDQKRVETLQNLWT